MGRPQFGCGSRAGLSSKTISADPVPSNVSFTTDSMSAPLKPSVAFAGSYKALAA